MYKHMLQVRTSERDNKMKQLTLWLLHFLIVISNSGYAIRPKMGNRNVNSMELGPRNHERVSNSVK